MQKSLVMLLVLSLGLGAAALRGAETAKPPVLTAAEVAARNADARGGLAAWRGIRSMSMSGRMEAGKGVLLPFTMELKRPRKMRLELTFQGKNAVQIYDGANGWKLRPYLNRTDVEAYSSDELQTAAAQADLDGPLLDYGVKGYSLELAGHEAVEGHEAYKLKVTRDGALVSYVWVDAANFLEVKADSVRLAKGSGKVVSTYFRDYRRISGVVIPHVLETAIEGSSHKNQMTIERVILNPMIRDTRFARP